MKIEGFYKRGAKEFVVFEDDNGKYKATDGFHDRTVKDFSEYIPVSREEIDVDRIVRRLRGARSWHPLLIALREASRL